jgi:hypothetical protein
MARQTVGRPRKTGQLKTLQQFEYDSVATPVVPGCSPTKKDSVNIFSYVSDVTVVVRADRIAFAFQSGAIGTNKSKKVRQVDSIEPPSCTKALNPD